MAVKRLRTALEPLNQNGRSVLRTVKGGYLLTVADGELDADEFESLVDGGLKSLSGGRPALAIERFRAAEALWRGPPLAEVSYESFAIDEIRRLDELRLRAFEGRFDAELELGRHAGAVGDMEAQHAAHPTNDGLAARLMVAYYRCGRDQDALNVFQRVRTRKAEEGLEPGPALQEMQRRVLEHDPRLQLQPRSLPSELDADDAAPFVGRDDAVTWLEGHWRRALKGRGSLVSAAGPDGIGKTRLAAEMGRIAYEANEADVLYASCEHPESVAETLARARQADHPTFVVLDDADREMLGDLADLTHRLSDVPVLTLVMGEDHGLLRAAGGSDSLELRPIDVDAVRQIAGAYGPADGDDPGEWLFRKSGGVPARVHQFARQWARDEAERRVSDAVDRTAAGRAELRSLEAELADEVTELRATQERVSIPQGNGATVICPFKGLTAFDAVDAEYYFGRERLIAELVARLVGTRLLGIIGPSGSGKSSALRAGLLPALAAGVVPGSESWKRIVVRPGEHPPRDLDPGARRFVVAVDQFEETFTTCTDESERAAFIEHLVDIAENSGGRGIVLLALRADQYGRCSEYPELSRLLTPSHVLVQPMDEEELRQAIECPARRAGLTVEPELTRALVDDVEGEPGGLPLLSTALLELWQHRSGRDLTLSAYRRTGGVHGAVGRLAEDAYNTLEEEQQPVAHDVLMRLVGETNDGLVERRRVSQADLHVDERSDIAAVVETLTERRLITTADGAIELAHEALLREWPRLCRWIEDDRERMRVERKLRAAASDWEASGRDDEDLYGRARLAPADEMAKRGMLELDVSERAFLSASRAKVLRRRQARRRQLTYLIGLLTFALVAITVFAIDAVNQRQDADRQRNLAVSRELALESGNVLDSDPELGLRLALWALETEETDQAAFALREAVLAYHERSELPADDTDANAAAYNADGTRVVTGGTDGVIRVWDPATEHRTAELPADHGPVLSARFAPTGDQVGAGFEDGTLVLTDGSLRASRELLPKTEEWEVSDVAFSSDGTRIAAGLSDGTVRVFDTSGDPDGVILTGFEDDVGVLGVALDADGSHVVAAGDDRRVLLWDAVEGAQAHELHDGVEAENAVAFSPDGRVIAGVGDDRRVRLWDARTHKPLRDFDGVSRELQAVAFSRDGRRIGAGGRDGVIRVWDARGGQPVVELRGQGGRIYDLGFGPDADDVVSAGDDGTAKTWDAGSALAWSVPGEPSGIDFAPDGSVVASSGDDGVARVYDAKSGAMRRRVTGTEGYTAASFSPGSDELVVGWDEDSRIRVWPWRGGAASTVQLPEEQRK